MLRISETSDGSGTTLQVDGRLSGGAVGELVRVAGARALPLTLDLSGLLFADEDGVVALEALEAYGADLRNVPPYVSLLLERDAVSSDAARTRARSAPGGSRRER